MNLGTHTTTGVCLSLILSLAAVPGLAATTPPASATEVQRGHYLAIAGDCEACHTAPGGQPFAGGLPVETPIGPIFSTNITPSKSDGIGEYTLQQFSNAVRKGVDDDGAHLYPAMPYTSYAQLNDADVRALYAYFMHGVQPVNSRPPETHLPFPFSLRFSMAFWNLMFLDKKPFTPDPAKSAQWNRGAYLARGLTHCSTCHTPRNLLMAEEPSRELAGASLGTWFAPNITPDADSGIDNWTTQEIVEYLKTGSAPGKGQAAGPMAEAVNDSFQYMTTSDLTAIAVYLKSVPAQRNPKDTRPADAQGKPYADFASIRGKPLPAAPDEMTGPQLYDAYCSSCHEDRGQGSFDGGLPSLFHNSATGRRNTDNLVMAILDGTAGKAGGFSVQMPAFAQELSNRQIATLGNYLTQHFGNPEAKVTVDQVRILRAGGATSNLVLLVRILMAIVLAIVIAIIVAIIWVLTRRRRQAVPPPTR